MEVPRCCWPPEWRSVWQALSVQRPGWGHMPLREAGWQRVLAGLALPLRGLGHGTVSASASTFVRREEE